MKKAAKLAAFYVGCRLKAAMRTLLNILHLGLDLFLGGGATAPLVCSKYNYTQ